MTLENEQALESAIADIQLFGSQTQTHLARSFALDFAQNGQANLDSLLESLRTDLRQELKLGPALGKVTYLRIQRNNQKS